MKIQEEEEVLTLLSGSEDNSISNIKFPMHTVLIFKEQAKVKESGLRENCIALPPQYKMNNPNSYCLDLQRTSKSQGTTIK
jgi:hypothetical protein